MTYKLFAGMIGTSTGGMYGLMYLNTYAWEHVWWSETRFYMAFLMGATMAMIMLGFMLSMYKNKKVNISIFAGSILVFLEVLYLIRIKDAATSIQRVSMRASQGAHDVPNIKLRARFKRTRANLARAIQRLPHVLVFDNSDLSHPYRLVERHRDGERVDER
jgi:hypothetical protein